MAVVHFAYTFDLDGLHTILKAFHDPDGKLDTKRLQTSAKSLVDAHSDWLMPLLNNMRYDKAWLDDPDNDASQAYLWLTVHLASMLNSCPSLSNNRFHGSHQVLEEVLPLAGWEHSQIHKRIFGASLNSLWGKSDNIGDELTIHGGVLGADDTKACLMRLTSSAAYFSDRVAQAQEVIKTYGAANGREPQQLLNMAYEDAKEMLETAINRGEVLYLLRDS